MKYDEWIIGYDARFILQSDIPKIMNRKASADSSIWPSIFNQGEYPALSHIERKRIGLGVEVLPECVGINHPFWEDLHKLEDYLDSLKQVKIRPYWIIAITGLFEEIEKKVNSEDWPRYTTTVLKDVSQDWRLLGYDVNSKNDEDDISWLFSLEDKCNEKLQIQWAQRLNPYGLFNDVKDAVEFRDYEDDTTPIDKPHFVRGLWVVRGHLGAP
jgi:hypothetical protein